MANHRRKLDSDDELTRKAGETLARLRLEFPEDEVKASVARLARGESLTVVTKFWIEPVGFQEFVESKAYMNKPNVLFPRVMKELIELNNGSYVESVLTGGIGSGKTTGALYTQAYQLYRLSCLRNPHKEFELDNSSEILIVFQSLNAALAADVDYTRFRHMIRDAPYFQRAFRFDPNYQSAMKFPHNIIVKPISGQESGAIGQNVIGGVIDEIDFMAVVENSKVKRDGSVYDQAIENYNSIARRRESRFMRKGNIPGMLCLVSSKNYPGGMTDRKQAEARDNPRIFVYDKRIYEIDPDRFTPERFRVFVGDEYRKPRIMEDDEIADIQDEALIAHVPEEYRKQFEGDIIKSIRDIAGHATQTIHPFMLNSEAVAACFGTTPGLADSEWVDFVKHKLQIFPARLSSPAEPRFAHVDLAISRDSAGLAIGHVAGFKHMNRGEYQETLPVIVYDLILEIRPPRGGEIEFEEIRRILYTLRDKFGVPIKWVSFDNFQSTDSQQILAKNGFMTGYQSMDTDTGPYDLLKLGFYDGRIKAPTHARARKECVTLEFDAKHQKVDHPPQGSKDVSDAMAGVAFGLTMLREIWVRHNISLTRFPTSLEKVNRRSVEAKAKQADNYLDRVREARGVAPVAREREEDRGI